MGGVSGYWQYTIRVLAVYCCVADWGLGSGLVEYWLQTLHGTGRVPFVKTLRVLNKNLLLKTPKGIRPIPIF